MIASGDGSARDSRVFGEVAGAGRWAAGFGLRNAGVLTGASHGQKAPMVPFLPFVGWGAPQGKCAPTKKIAASLEPSGYDGGLRRKLAQGL